MNSGLSRWQPGQPFLPGSPQTAFGSIHSRLCFIQRPTVLSPRHNHPPASSLLLSTQPAALAGNSLIPLSLTSPE